MNKTKQSATATRNGGRSISGWVIAGIAALVVALAAVIAIATSSGDEPSSDPGISETRPVEVSGTPLAAYVADTSDPTVGVVAPTLAGQEFDGTPIAVQPGRPTLVIFLAHWCPHCQREVPVLTQWEAAGGVPEGVDVIGVASGTDPALPNYPPSQWLADEQFPFPVMADSEASDAATSFGLSGFPYFVLLDADGKVVQRASGEIDPATLTPVLESLVAS
jgi:cytochrome c biogenesis protein CcmG, thiol:disulfide interchange protein DsbE